MQTKEVTLQRHNIIVRFQKNVDRITREEFIKLGNGTVSHLSTIEFPYDWGLRRAVRYHVESRRFKDGWRVLSTNCLKKIEE